MHLAAHGPGAIQSKPANGIPSPFLTLAKHGKLPYKFAQGE
jgi:hypothetical protein